MLHNFCASPPAGREVLVLASGTGPGALFFGAMAGLPPCMERVRNVSAGLASRTLWIAKAPSATVGPDGTEKNSDVEAGSVK